jgi:glycosyltransferase involved in cell wall biosynthesis
MKILYVCSDLGVPVLGRKGASVHVRQLVGALARRGHSVVLAAPLLTKSPWEMPASVEAHVLHLPPSAEADASRVALRKLNETIGVANEIPREVRSVLWDAQVRPVLKRSLERDPPDVVYERPGLFATAAAAVAESFRVPRLVELNAPLALEHTTYRGHGLDGLVEAAERWTLARADAVIAVSEGLREHAISRGADPARVEVHPNGVDTERFRPGPREPSLRRRWNVGSGPLLGFVGGLRAWHGLEALPGLLDRLLPRHPGLRLVVAGDGPLRGELEERLRRAGHTDRVVFTGWLDHEEIPRVIREFDLALAPYSHSDYLRYASPLKVFEYLACGVPVVAPRAGQFREVLRDGETGLLYELAGEGHLAAACDRLLSDGDLRRRLGAAGADDVRRRYTWDRNAERVVALAASLNGAVR